MTRSLEQSVESYLPEQEGALDFLVVLGGGTSEGPHRAEANAGGDRVLYAAQLYHQGHVGKLITTGQVITSLVGSDARDPAEQTVEVWTRLGIPPEAIVQLPGRNTFEEMQAIKKFYESDDGGGELGILTSATHLPRAMRLAKSQGLESARGLAANHRYRAGSVSWVDYLPSAAALDQWGRCQHEYMAKLVGR